MADDYVNESVPLGIKIPYHRNDLDGYFAQNRSTLLRYKTNLMISYVRDKRLCFIYFHPQFAASL